MRQALQPQARRLNRIESQAHVANMANLIPTHLVAQPEDDLRQTIQSTHTEQLEALSTGQNSPRVPYETSFSPLLIQPKEEYSLELSPSEVVDR